MKIKQIVVLLAALALVLPLGAQMGMGMRMPDMSGIWHPVVGAGGAYEMTDQSGKKTQMEMTIVGKEDIGGKPGFWMEMAMANPRSGGDMFMKYLVAPGDGGMAATRMIMQMPGQDPMEMDMNMMGGRGCGHVRNTLRHSIQSRFSGLRVGHRSRRDVHLSTLPRQRRLRRRLDLRQGRTLGPGENAGQG